jgi:hypothetical protein
MIGDYFRSGRVVDFILLIIALEFAALLWRGRAAGLRLRALDLFFTLAPGACILIALRCALTGAGFIWIAFWLGASFPVHLGDLWRRR